VGRIVNVLEAKTTGERTEADDFVEEVRRVKREISAEFEHDPAKLVAFLTEYQKQFADRLSQPPLEGGRGKPAA
jgi:hypothetical protein